MLIPGFNVMDPYFIVSEFPMESQIIGKAREINNYKAFWVAEKIKTTNDIPTRSAVQIEARPALPELCSNLGDAA